MVQYTIIIMFIVLLLRWWYGPGWAWLVRRIASKYKFIAEALSVDILLRTFFAPWKQIQSTVTLQTFIQSTVDNLMSRFIGMAVRSLMLFTALILTLMLSAFAAVAFAVWPALPMMVVILPILTIKGVIL